MNDRERFLNWMTFQPVDRMPFMEMGFWDETFERWHHEGLPQWVTHDRHLESYLKLDLSFNRNWLPINSLVYPQFERRVLEETESDEIIQNENGVICRQSKRMRSIPQFIKFPVQNEADYDALLPRLNGRDAGRYTDDFDEDLFWRWERGEIIGINFHSFFGYLRDLMGLENTAVAFYDQPHLVKRMIADRLEFAKQCYSRVMETGKLNFVQIWEDMAYKAGPLISPRFVREYMLPAYQELVQFFRRGGVQLLMVDCDGNMNSLLPLWLEAGIDGVHPVEIAAGCNPLEIRRKYPGIRLMGGLDKRLIATGKVGIEESLAQIKPLFKEGGFIPFVDHFVPPDISYQDFLYLTEQKRSYIERPYHD